MLVAVVVITMVDVTGPRRETDDKLQNAHERPASPRGRLIASVAGAVVAHGRGGSVGAEGVWLHTTGTSGADAGEFCCCPQMMIQQVSETWVGGERKRVIPVQR